MSSPDHPSNLSQVRTQPDVWERMESHRQRSNALRLITAAGALALFVFARRRSKVLRTVGLLGAAALARQALACDGVSRLVSQWTGIPMPACDEQHAMDEAGEDSFPASDPPATASTSTASA